MLLNALPVSAHGAARAWGGQPPPVFVVLVGLGGVNPPTKMQVVVGLAGILGGVNPPQHSTPHIIYIYNILEFAHGACEVAQSTARSKAQLEA